VVGPQDSLAQRGGGGGAPQTKGEGTRGRGAVTQGGKSGLGKEGGAAETGQRGESMKSLMRLW